MKIYITFDGLYNINSYNQFIESAIKNKLEFKEYISIKAPYRWYIEIDQKYAPMFLQYSLLPKGDEKWLLEKINGLNPNEQWLLKRKVSSLPQNFEEFVSPYIFRQIPYEPYCVAFKYKNKDELVRYSKELGLKIYVLGKQREWNLAFCFNKYIRNYIFKDQILLEKTDPKQFLKAGEFEYTLNFKKLVKIKLSNKTLEYPYYEDGVYHPLIKNTKIRAK